MAIVRKALELDPRTECLTVFQDDIVLSKNALDYIQHIEIHPDLAAISWYSGDWIEPDFMSRPILGCRPSRFFYASLGLTLPRRTLNDILYCPMATRWHRRNLSDILLAWILMDKLYAEHCPNLIQHPREANSACGHSTIRTSAIFAGENFDSLSLLSGKGP